MPRVVITDKLGSYGAALREVMPAVLHRSHKELNNRAHNSHQPTRQRQQAIKGLVLPRPSPTVLGRFQLHLPTCAATPPPFHRPQLPQRDEVRPHHLHTDHRYHHCSPGRLNHTPQGRSHPQHVQPTQNHHQGDNTDEWPDVSQLPHWEHDAADRSLCGRSILGALVLLLATGTVATTSSWLTNRIVGKQIFYTVSKLCYGEAL
jgi:putative transposase